MYHSLKRQNRIRLPQGGTILATPRSSNRTEPPSTDEADLIAISNCMKKGQPLYFIRTDTGHILDVLTTKDGAQRRHAKIQDRFQNGAFRARIYERIGTTLVPV